MEINLPRNFTIHVNQYKDGMETYAAKRSNEILQQQNISSSR
ncbi:MAG: hypothetical protein QW350_02820 [Candidatus Aenigmatarchaeota archaeon]